MMFDEIVHELICEGSGIDITEPLDWSKSPYRNGLYVKEIGSQSKPVIKKKWKDCKIETEFYGSVNHSSESVWFWMRAKVKKKTVITVKYEIQMSTGLKGHFWYPDLMGWQFIKGIHCIEKLKELLE